MIKLEIPGQKLELIAQALRTQIRLLESYMNRSDEMQLEINKFRSLLIDIEQVLLDQ